MIARMLLMLACALQLGAQWVYNDRMGMTVFNEVACYRPNQVATSTAGEIAFTIQKTADTCSDYLIDGTPQYGPTTRQYRTGGAISTSVSWLYGTMTARAKMPLQATGSWPAIWFLGTNCMEAAKKSGQMHLGKVDPVNCPAYQQSGSLYREIDVIECMTWGGNSWCQTNMFKESAGGTACAYSIGDSNYHTWTATWTPTSLVVAVDGVTKCTYSTNIPDKPVFMQLTMQGNGNSPSISDANLPAVMTIDYVELKDSNGNVIFRDDFDRSSVWLE